MALQHQDANISKFKSNLNNPIKGMVHAVVSYILQATENKTTKMRAYICIVVIISLSAIIGSSAYGDGVESIVSSDQFDQMLRHRNDNGCPARLFYSYHAFLAAANSFSGFGTTGDTETRKREIAAFLGQTSHETSGGWESAPDGPYAWGYCFKEEHGNPSDYCSFSLQWPCVPGQKYYGRGPMQITHNYNYGAAGKAIGENLLGNPDLVASDPTISFKTAIWYWMTPEWPIKPSSHDVITGRWYPNPADALAGRHPGYGTITNIINGGLECGHGYDASATDRIGFYKRYCHILGVSPGSNLDCNHQLPFVPHIGAAAAAAI